MDKVNCNRLHNLMTLAAEQDYSFLTNTVLFEGLHCLFSVAVVNEDIPSVHLKKNQKVITSPMIANHMGECFCQVYGVFDVDVDSGLFLPIVSWANEFTKQILLDDASVTLTEPYGMLEKIMQQIWDFEEVIQSADGVKLELKNPVTWKSMIEERISWENYDSLAQAETLLKEGVVSVEEITLPHVHTENIEYFRKAGLCKEVIIDW